MDKEKINYVRRYFDLREQSIGNYTQLMKENDLEMTVVFCKFDETTLPLGYIYSLSGGPDLPVMYTHGPVFNSKDGEVCGFMGEIGLLLALAELPSPPFEAGIAEFERQGGQIYTVSYGAGNQISFVEENGLDRLIMELVLTAMFNPYTKSGRGNEHFVPDYWKLANRPEFSIEHRLVQIAIWLKAITETQMLVYRSRMVQKIIPLRVIDYKTRKNPAQYEIDLTKQLAIATRMGTLDGFPWYIKTFRIPHLEPEVYANPLTRQRFRLASDQDERMAPEAILVLMPYLGPTFQYFFRNCGNLVNEEFDFENMAAPLFVWFWELAMLHLQGIVHGDLHLNNVTLRPLPRQIASEEREPVPLLGSFRLYRAGGHSWYLPFQRRHPTIIDFSRSFTLDNVRTLELIKSVMPDFYKANEPQLRRLQESSPVPFGRTVASLDQLYFLDQIVAETQLEGSNVRLDSLVDRLRVAIRDLVQSRILEPLKSEELDLDVAILDMFEEFKPSSSPVLFIHPAGPRLKFESSPL